MFGNELKAISLSQYSLLTADAAVNDVQHFIMLNKRIFMNSPRSAVSSTTIYLI